MRNCPKCHHSVKPNAVVCPNCHTQLKAFGHPGMDLHHVKQGQKSLCLTCTYHADDSCNYPKRPHAQECTLYQEQNPSQDKPDRPSKPSPRRTTGTSASNSRTATHQPSRPTPPRVTTRLRHNQGLVLILG
ncbi:MAG: zinc ribbon domain-containing protein, partial [Synechococcales bacterium]|nr:zinc ribbon domain-containing protein [Synechococcales bacterium]